MIRPRMLALALTAAVVAAPFARAVEPDEILADAALEARARSISAELRCLICQNQSIDDSSAPLARDLRLVVREQLKTGATDAAVLDHVVARYGQYVLLRPRLSAQTALLWGAPLLLIGIAGMLLVRRARAGAVAPVEPVLSADEQARLDRMTGNSTP